MNKSVHYNHKYCKTARSDPSDVVCSLNLKIWDQKEILEHITSQKNYSTETPAKCFYIGLVHVLGNQNSA